MKWNNERVQDVGDDVPIKCRHWVEPETFFNPCDGGKVIIIRCDPSNPVEQTEST